MKELKHSDLEQLKSAFYKVFLSTDPFGEMFQESIKSRLILCPIDGYYLEENQFSALQKVAKALDDDKFYVSEVEAGERSFESIQESDKYLTRHWECDIPLSFKQYLDIPIILENAIFSVKGNWGILISHEEHAVIGGSIYFIKLFKEFYPAWGLGSKNFLEKWEENQKNYNSNNEWVENFIKHING